jgi:hypothetical protein
MVCSSFCSTSSYGPRTTVNRLTRAVILQMAGGMGLAEAPF